MPICVPLFGGVGPADLSKYSAYVRHALVDLEDGGARLLLEAVRRDIGLRIIQNELGHSNDVERKIVHRGDCLRHVPPALVGKTEPEAAIIVGPIGEEIDAPNEQIITRCLLHDGPHAPFLTSHPGDGAVDKLESAVVGIRPWDPREHVF